VWAGGSDGDPAQGDEAGQRQEDGEERRSGLRQSRYLDDGRCRRGSIRGRSGDQVVLVLVAQGGRGRGEEVEVERHRVAVLNSEEIGQLMKIVDLSTVPVKSVRGIVKVEGGSDVSRLARRGDRERQDLQGDRPRQIGGRSLPASVPPKLQVHTMSAAAGLLALSSRPTSVPAVKRLRISCPSLPFSIWFPEVPAGECSTPPRPPVAWHRSRLSWWSLSIEIRPIRMINDEQWRRSTATGT